MTENFKRKMSDGAYKLGIELEDIQLERLYYYYQFLIKKSKIMNLTTITDEDDVIYKHFVDSLSIVKVLDLNTFQDSNKRVLDLGTGAGFPGLVIKIVFPGIDMALLDATKKKLDFLDELITKLKIDKVRTVHGRAETIAHDEGMRETFDLVLSRAVAYLPVLLEYTLPFLKIDGSFVAYKSEKIAEEIGASHASLKTLGGNFLSANSFLLPGSGIRRCLVVIEKCTQTPLKYPRRYSALLRKPL